jgi:hypothetical protein
VHACLTCNHGLEHHVVFVTIIIIIFVVVFFFFYRTFVGSSGGGLAGTSVSSSLRLALLGEVFRCE